MKKMKTGIGVMLALLCCILMCTGVVYATVSQSGSSGFALERGKPNAEHKNKSGFTSQTGGVELSAPPVA